MSLTIKTGEIDVVVLYGRKGVRQNRISDGHIGRKRERDMHTESREMREKKYRQTDGQKDDRKKIRRKREEY